MGRNHLAMAGLSHAIRHARVAGASWRLRSQSGLLFRRLVHVEVRSVSSWQLRHAVIEDGISGASSGLGTLHRRRHPERGLGESGRQRRATRKKGCEEEVG